MAAHFFRTILLIPRKLDFPLRYCAPYMRYPYHLTISLPSDRWSILDNRSITYDFPPWIEFLSKLDHDAVAVIYLMLDNLGSPAYIFAVLLLKICVQIVHFNFFISRAWSYSIQRKAAFLCLKSPGFLCDHRIDHCKLKWSCCHYNNIFAHSDHVRRHPDAMI